MKAVGLYKYLPIDHPESLLDLEIETSIASGQDLLVEVKAISVNPVDTKRRAPKDLVETTPKILGWDAAGVVKAAGPDCRLFKPGDAVYYAGSAIRQGANCQFHLVDERIVGRKPANLSFAESAALPLTTLTAWELRFERMGISKAGADGKNAAGKTLLFLGGAGGVGSIAIQHDKSISVCLQGMFTRSTFQTPDMAAQHALLDETAGLIEAGVLKTTLTRVLGEIDAANLKLAHKMLEEGHVTGKLVLEGW